jgi:hypothetical protein
MKQRTQTLRTVETKSARLPSTRAPMLRFNPNDASLLRGVITSCQRGGNRYESVGCHIQMNAMEFEADFLGHRFRAEGHCPEYVGKQGNEESEKKGL